MTRESIIPSMSAVTEPSNAMFVTGSGAICDDSDVQRWKMLLPTNTMPPAGGCAASAGATRNAVSASARSCRRGTGSAAPVRRSRCIVGDEHANPPVLPRRDEEFAVLAAPNVEVRAADFRSHRLVDQLLQRHVGARAVGGCIELNLFDRRDGLRNYVVRLL